MIIPRTAHPIECDFPAFGVQQVFEGKNWLERKLKKIHTTQITLTHGKEIQGLQKFHYEFSDILDFSSFQNLIARFFLLASPQIYLELHSIPTWTNHSVKKHYTKETAKNIIGC